MNDDHLDNLDWQAFRYVAGEMDATEAASFERRLNDDLAACEAVAQAVELTRAVALAEQSATGEPGRTNALRPVDRRRSRWTRRAELAIAVAAAALAVVLVWPRGGEQRRSAPNESGAAAASGADPIEQLALAWSETGEQLALLGVDTWPIDGDEPDADNEVLPDAVAALDDESELAPSWMLAAVADLRQTSPSSLPTEPLGEER